MKRMIFIVVAFSLLALPVNSHALTQFDQLELHSAPPKIPARIAIIDTSVDSHGTMLGNRAIVKQGDGNGHPTSHGSMMVTAITGGWVSDGRTNTGTAVGSTVDFYGCNLNEGIDLYCSITALEWAVTTNVRVINLSFASHVNIPAEFESRYVMAIAQAEMRGITVVASAGDGTTLPFPARLANVISVSSLNWQNKKTNPRALTSALGQDLVVYSPRGIKLIGNGSSYATAYTTGVIARIISLRPTLTPADIRRIVKGRVNMTKHLRAIGVKPYVVPPPKCLNMRPIGNLKYILTWSKVPHVRMYKVQIGNKFYYRQNNTMQARVTKKQTVTVRSIAQYSQLSKSRAANTCRK